MNDADYIWLVGQALMAWFVGFGAGLGLRHYRKFFESAAD